MTRLVIATLLAVALGVAREQIQPILPPTAVPERVAGLVHLGSFNIPDGAFGGPPNKGFNYGGTALGFNPKRNSLFMVGHDQEQLLAEVSIPELDGTAQVLQNFVDPTGGRIGAINPRDPNKKVIGGTLPWGDQLLVSAYSYYDGEGSQVLSHFVRSQDLSDRSATGPMRIGSLGAGVYSGYMGVVPPEWQEKLGGPALAGNAGISVISRSSYGPAVFAFDPDRLTPSGAQPLVYYPESQQALGRWDDANEYYGGSDTIRGVAMVPGTLTVLFFGRHGETFCYGTGTSDKDLASRRPEHGDPFCYDPMDSSKGVHGYPYSAYVWAYDANDLAAVRAGRRQPWSVKPYAVFTLPDMPASVGGATIDPATGRIYVSGMFGNRTLPVVHVFKAQ